MADQGPTGPRPLAVYPRPLVVVAVFCGELVDIEEAGEERLTIGAAAIKDELVAEGASKRPMHHQVLELDQAREMHLELRLSPAGLLAELAAREAHVASLEVLGGSASRDDLVERAPGAGGSAARARRAMRPSTSCASRLATAMSSSVTSM